MWDVQNISPFRCFAMGMLVFSLSLLLCAFSNLRRLLRHKTPYLTPNSSYTEEDFHRCIEAMDSDHNEENVGEKEGAGSTAHANGDSRKEQPPFELLVETAKYDNFRTWIFVQFCVYCNTLMQMKFAFWFAEALFRDTWADGLQGYLVATANVTRGALSFFVILPLVHKLSLYTIFQRGCQLQFLVCLLGISGVITVPYLMPVLFVLNLVRY